MGNLTVDGLMPLAKIRDRQDTEVRQVEKQDTAIFPESQSETSEKDALALNSSKFEVFSVITSIVSEDEKLKESKKNWFSKTVDWLASPFKSEKKSSSSDKNLFFSASAVGGSFKNTLLSLKQKAISDLAKQGVDFDELTRSQKIKYLTALANHKFKNIDNKSLLKTMTEIYKERVKDSVISLLPPGIKEFSGFLKDKFSVFFEKTGKIDNAAVKTAMENAPQEIAQQLLLLYSSSIEERRAEVLSEAFKVLPKEFDREAILQFAVTSEKMSDTQFEFAKTLIENSDLPDEIKQEHLKRLEDNKKKQRENTTKWAEAFYKSSREAAYNYHKGQIAENNAMYEVICANQKEIDKKLSEFKEKQKNMLNEQYQNKQKLKKAKKDMLKQIAKGQKFSARFSIEYREMKEKEKTLKTDLVDIKKLISDTETSWGIAQHKRWDLVHDSSLHVGSMSTIASMDKQEKSLISKCSDFLKAIFS